MLLLIIVYLCDCGVKPTHLRFRHHRHSRHCRRRRLQPTIARFHQIILLRLASQYRILPYCGVCVRASNMASNGWNGNSKCASMCSVHFVTRQIRDTQIYLYCWWLHSSTTLRSHFASIFILHANNDIHNNLFVDIIIQFAGVIRTKARIDYESIKQIHLNAYVTDTGVPQLTSTAEIIIDIINTNDNDPVFNSTDYKLSVLENSTKGTVVGKVAANDNDDGMCNSVVLPAFNLYTHRRLCVKPLIRRKCL